MPGRAAVDDPATRAGAPRPPGATACHRSPHRRRRPHSVAEQHEDRRERPARVPGVLLHKAARGRHAGDERGGKRAASARSSRRPPDAVATRWSSWSFRRGSVISRSLPPTRTVVVAVRAIRRRCAPRPSPCRRPPGPAGTERRTRRRRAQPAASRIRAVGRRDVHLDRRAALRLERVVARGDPQGRASPGERSRGAAMATGSAAPIAQPAQRLSPERVVRVVRRRQQHAPAPRRFSGEHHAERPSP